MRLYAFLWILVGPYRFVCVLMDSNESLWVLIGLYAFSWVLIRSNPITNNNDPLESIWTDKDLKGSIRNH